MGWAAACPGGVSGSKGQEADNALGLASFCGSPVCRDSIIYCPVCWKLRFAQAAPEVICTYHVCCLLATPSGQRLLPQFGLISSGHKQGK